MSEILEKLHMYFQYDFVLYALILGILIALVSSLLGVILVLRGYSFISSGLSNLAFAVTCFASAMYIFNDFLIVLPATFVCAAILMRRKNLGFKRGDASIAMLSAASLASGYIIINLFPSSGNVSADVCTTLFGSTSILTLTETQLITGISVSLVVTFAFIIFYKKIFIITFDEDFSAACRLNTAALNYVMALMISSVIVLAIKLVGSLLISALIIFPPVSAMKVCRSFKGVSIFSAICSVICAGSGIVFSIIFSTPVGSSIVVINLLFYAVLSLFSVLGKGAACA